MAHVGSNLHSLLLLPLHLWRMGMGNPGQLRRVHFRQTVSSIRACDGYGLSYGYDFEVNADE